MSGSFKTSRRRQNAFVHGGGYYSPRAFLIFKLPFGSAFNYLKNCERDIYCEKKSLGPFKTVGRSSAVELEVLYDSLLSNTENDHIEQQAGFLYRCRENDILRLRAILTERTWIRFDLDNAFHMFYRSSGIVTNRILEDISEGHGTPIPAFRDKYSEILKRRTASAFF